MIGYMLSDDLMFTSRVRAIARAAKLEVQNARSIDQLSKLMAATTPRCIIIDLQNPGMSISDLMQALPQPRPFVVGYGSHVDTATLQAARDAGCNLVLTRSKFVDELDKSLPNWFAPEKPPTESEA
jgi:DNA-binding NarL/FixJ family response regulator